MKKYLYQLLAIAALWLGTASCSNEDEVIPSGKDEGVEVNFNLSLEGTVPSRAADHDVAGDVYATGKTVDNVIAAVFFNGEEIMRKPTNKIESNLTCKVTFRLIEG